MNSRGILSGGSYGSVTQRKASFQGYMYRLKTFYVGFCEKEKCRKLEFITVGL